MTPALRAAENVPARFAGAEICSTAGCHGGADPKRFQFQYWKHADPHSKAFSTLTTARSARMAEDLKLGDATKNLQCTSCHAPFHALPANLVETPLSAMESVSCESCHGAASNWKLSHTRPDYSHAQRVSTGMRDLQNLYVRANSCVACHQSISSDLLKAGHPELIFELDGQTQSQPRHWQEKPDYHRGQAWLTGQAVALREMTAQLLREKTPNPTLVLRWQAVKWLVQQSRVVSQTADHLVTLSDDTSRSNLETIHRIADQLAKETSDAEWNETQTRQLLKRLASLKADFSGKTSQPLAARRAERLVLALDRLSAALPENVAKSLDDSLKKLFASAQVLEDFKAENFAKELDALAAKL
ncbi:MAG TPA: multiheme c-type cytochrome [Verrucomicrobiae bacterium]